MKHTDPSHSPNVFIEIGQTSLKIGQDKRGAELPIERSDNGRLTEACKERLPLLLINFLNTRPSSKPIQAICAITARGVSLRRITLPPTNKESFDRLLQLQIEREFPLPPDELAWGLCPPEPPNAQRSDAREVTVIAVRKETIDEYTALLSQCGLVPSFTLSALATDSIPSHSNGPWALLDIGRSHSELAAFENGLLTTLRTLPWGGDTITRSVQDALGTTFAEAERLKLHLGSNIEAGATTPNGTATGADAPVRDAVTTALTDLSRLLRPEWNGPTLYLTGKTASLPGIAGHLSHTLEGPVRCEPRPVESGEPGSAAIASLRKHPPSLVIQAGMPTPDPARRAQPSLRKWVALAALLAVVSLSLRYIEPLIQSPRLAQRIAEVRMAKENLTGIDIDLGFLQYIQTNQSPYLNILAAIADASPKGTKLENVSLGRRGDVSIRGILPGAAQAVDFRSKLIASGWFSEVVLDEQTPIEKKINLRLSAHWNLHRTADTPPGSPADKPR